MSTKVMLKNVRLAFPSLFEAKAIGDGKPRFSAAFPILPNSENAKACEAAMVEAAKEKWKDKAPLILAELIKKDRVAFKKFALSKDGVVYEGFNDMYTVNAANKVRPLVLNNDKTPLTEADGKVYAGCYVYAQIEFYAQDNKDPGIGKRINGVLKGVQFYRDGDAFSGGTPASPDEFETLEEGAQAEDLA